MAALGEEQIITALRSVMDPDRGRDIVTEGMISGIIIKNGNVQFAIEVEPERGPKLESLRQQAEAVVRTVPGVISVTAVLTAHNPAPAQPAPPPGPGGHGHGSPRAQEKLLSDIGAVVAVASGKGGVGKSTTAVNLAVALAQQGHRTALLDADIYGPSIPLMLGIRDKPQSPDGEKLLPLENHGVKCMSIGFMVPTDTPTIWRGPMVMGALQQLMSDTDWGPTDIMIVDLPPGTGDAQLTLAQRVAVSGAVIVSTPQDLALLDARKALNMFRKVDVPVLGIVENMSYFVCPLCGGESDIFARGGAERTAKEMGTEFLGAIPLELAIREGGDSGNPITAAAPDGPDAEAYRAIAEKIWSAVGATAQTAGAARR